MDALQFDKIVEEVHSICKETLKSKGDIYADADRFRNFKNVSRIKNSTKYDALFGMFLKHFEAWMKFMEDPREVPLEEWLEKTVDMINYITLCYGMAYEDITNPYSDTPSTVPKPKRERV